MEGLERNPFDPAVANNHAADPMEKKLVAAFDAMRSQLRTELQQDVMQAFKTALQEVEQRASSIAADALSTLRAELLRELPVDIRRSRRSVLGEAIGNANDMLPLEAKQIRSRRRISTFSKEAFEVRHSTSSALSPHARNSLNQDGNDSHGPAGQGRRPSLSPRRGRRGRADERRHSRWGSYISLEGNAEFQEVASWALQQYASNFVHSERFDLFVACIIILNAVWIGVCTDFSAKHPGEPEPTVLRVLDLSFFATFCFELALRIFAEGCGFFADPDHVLWNIFDLSMVLLQALEELGQVCAFQFGLSSMNALLTLRIVRAVRVLRVVRLVRFLANMRLIVTSVYATLKSLVGAMLALTIVIFISAVALMQGVDKPLPESSLAEPFERMYGSVTNTMLMLFQSICGGLSWREATDLLSEVGGQPHVFLLFILYITFSTFAMLNVMTGVFVSQAMQTAQEEQDKVMLKNIRSLLQKTTSKNASELAWEEFASMTNEPEMLMLFQHIDVDIGEAEAFFRVLDTEATGFVDYTDFMSGCLRLRGPARSIDLLILSKEWQTISSWLIERVLHLCMCQQEVLAHLGNDASKKGHEPFTGEGDR